MKVRIVIAAMGAACGLMGALWIGGPIIATQYWGWQSRRDPSADAALWASCTDPGSAVVIRTIANDSEIPCSPELWLPWLEEDLARLGARQWAHDLVAHEASTPTQRFRLLLALSRAFGASSPELAPLLREDSVPPGERRWVRRWLLDASPTPKWVDPVVSETLIGVSFLESDPMPVGDWLDWLRHVRVVPASAPDALLDHVVMRAGILLDSAAPEDVQRPVCTTATSACIDSILRIADRTIRADEDGWDGGPDEEVERAEPVPDSLGTALWRARYGDETDAADKADSAAWWLHTTSAWLARRKAKPADLLLRVFAETADYGPLHVRGGEAGDPAEVIGRRRGSAWASALAVVLLAPAIERDVAVFATPGGARVQLGEKRLAWGACGAPGALEGGTRLTDRQVLARAAVEASGASLARSDSAAAARLAGLAERADPEAFSGLTQSLTGLAATPARQWGARIGRTGPAAEPSGAWAAAWRAVDDANCPPALPTTPAVSAPVAPARDAERSAGAGVEDQPG